MTPEADTSHMHGTCQKPYLAQCAHLHSAATPVPARGNYVYLYMWYMKDALLPACWLFMEHTSLK